jgi:hypothetical protein
MSVGTKKTAGKKSASKADKPTYAASKTEAAGAYKPGSLLARRGGMVPTVRLGKRASTQAS